MSGDTSTCATHLDGAFHFIKHARAWKSKYSTKAQALHRIFFYLQTIHHSTALRRRHGDSRLLPGSTNVDTSLSFQTRSTEVLELLQDISPPSTDPSSRMTTYEYVYGVPRSLLSLMSQVTDTIHQVRSSRESTQDVSIPSDLIDLCDGVEKNILEWPIEAELQTHRQENKEGSADIICETTRAFHAALIIYFAQHVRLLPYRYLQPYVQTVLDCIEGIERIKAETQVLAAPLYWPAFIAASEAFDEMLQERFKSWYAHVDFYGIAAVRTGISVLTEVWEGSGTTMADRFTSRWRAVAERRRSSLMLS